MRAAALKAFRRLLEAAGPGDALAFVVPGASTGLAKALAAAGGCCTPTIHKMLSCVSSNNSPH